MPNVIIIDGNEEAVSFTPNMEYDTEVRKTGNIL
jgi:hypothetical protein